MTNHPDETHTLRDRVDEAISWFTGTDEPAEQTPEEPVAADVAVAPEAEVTTEASSTEVSPGPEDAPVVEAAAVPEVAEPVADEVREVPAPEPEPASTIAAWPPVSFPKPEPVAEAPVEPQAVAEPEPEPEAPAVEPVAEVPAEPVAEPEPAVEEPAAEAVQEAPAEESVEEQPVGLIESSEIDEPTRIHPIDEALGLPIDPEPEPEPQRSFFRDEAPAAAVGAGAFGATALAASAIPTTEQTAVLDAQEAARLRREERAARDRQLGKVIASQDDDEPLVTPFTTPSTYKGLPSFGFFLFRLIVAAVVGIRAWQHITHLTATRQMWAATVLPSPETLAWVQIGAEIAIVMMLVLGLGTRIAGLVLLVLSVLQLVFVQWGAVNPFQPNATDFIGIADVMLAGVGLLLATVGGGRAAIDGAIHVGHVKRKNSKLFA